MNSIPRSEYPRPQLVRQDWLNLNGTWSYEFDPGKSGVARGLAASKGFAGKITVPFCPESKLSGVGHTDFIEAMFYHRQLVVPADWSGKRIILHFGGVDYECEGFIDGKSVGRHFGGSVSFEFDITGFVTPGQTHDLVLKVLDDTRSGVQSVGKQSTEYHSHACSYTRVTGIWQTVWLEPVAMAGLQRCRITPDVDNDSFVFTPQFYAEQRGRKMRVKVSAAGKLVGETVTAAASGVSFAVKVAAPHLWSPEDPFLYDISYELTDAAGNVLETLEAYAGLRKIHIEGNRIFLNNREIFLRLVLDQGYYEDGIWTAPSDDALRRDIELSMAAGFNGARLHQKVFEERFHYWADRLGYLTWGESASWGNAFGNSSHQKPAPEYWQSLFNFLAEWREIIERDYNHPSIIAWTPANECWPGNDLALYRRSLSEIYDVTRQLDPTRPCNESSGYHHAKTDLWTVHFYRPTAKELHEALVPADYPVGRWNAELECEYRGQPYLNDEFGGFMFIPPDRRKFAENTWGYYGMSIPDEDEFCRILDEEVETMLNIDSLSGYCLTQLTDVEQEQNGVYNYDRTPKVAPERLKAIFGRQPKRLS
ncbi:glycoside hydrolase family 2 protein [Victivallis sp. Marseille-Q1083]|uniref:glycoside hydrolase family 2 protein n=1 Tax=Victivallis sp. Marseille-Q1083 TaxID=2717288 RepID=UPI00158CE8D0|nr:glycoside hydrolase family 2 TIM barrel-domain containing protein [Victivallis sp. Marseille-Q1083]